MEQGFLNCSSRVRNNDGGSTRKTGTLLSDLANSVKNIDGGIGDAVEETKEDDGGEEVGIPMVAESSKVHVAANVPAQNEKSSNNVVLESVQSDLNVNGHGNTSFASMLKDNNLTISVHLCELHNDEAILGADVSTRLQWMI